MSYIFEFIIMINHRNKKRNKRAHACTCIYMCMHMHESCCAQLQSRPPRAAPVRVYIDIYISTLNHVAGVHCMPAEMCLGMHMHIYGHATNLNISCHIQHHGQLQAHLYTLSTTKPTITVHQQRHQQQRHPQQRHHGGDYARAIGLVLHGLPWTSCVAT